MVLVADQRLSEVSAMTSAFVISWSLQSIWDLDSANPRKKPDHARHGGGHYHRVARGHVYDGAGIQRYPGCVLSPDCTFTYRLAADSSNSPGGEAAAGWTLKPARLDLRLCAHLWNLIRCCKLLLKETGLGIGLIALGLIAGAIIHWDLSRRMILLFE